MALSQATLSAELQAIDPSLDDDPTPLAQAYANYMKAAVAATPIVQASLVNAVIAMAGAMTFDLDATYAEGAAVVKAGLVAFWGAMNSPASIYFTGATLVTPPAGLSTIDGALAAAFEDNTADGTTLEDACDALASVIHAASAGGTVTTPGPTVTPIV